MRKPCPGCPFGYHKDALLHLREERLEEIANQEGTFTCHRTVEETGAPSGTEEKVCAGWLLYQWENEPGQMAQIIGRLDPTLYDELTAQSSQIVTDWDELLERHSP